MTNKKDTSSQLDEIESDGLLQKISSAEQKLDVALGANSKFEQGFSAYRQKMQVKGEQRNLEEAAKGLAASRNDFADLKQLMADLNVNLIQYSQEFNSAADQFGEYEGMYEKFFGGFLGKGESKIALWAKAKAKNSLLTRMRQNSLEKSANAMIAHGAKVAEVLTGGINTLTDCYNTLSNDRENAAKEYKQTDSKYEEWGKTAAGFKETLTDLEEKLKIADTKDRPDMTLQYAEVERQYQDAESKADQYLVKRDQAQEAERILKENIASYDQVIKNMKNIRVVVNSQVAHYGNMLPRLQKLSEVVTKMEGAGMYTDNVKASVNLGTRATAKLAKRAAEEERRVITTEAMTQEDLASAVNDIKAAVAEYNAGLETLEAREARKSGSPAQ